MSVHEETSRWVKALRYKPSGSGRDPLKVMRRDVILGAPRSCWRKRKTAAYRSNAALVHESLAEGDSPNLTKAPSSRHNVALRSCWWTRKRMQHGAGGKGG